MLITGEKTKFLLKAEQACAVGEWPVRHQAEAASKPDVAVLDMAAPQLLEFLAKNEGAVGAILLPEPWSASRRDFDKLRKTAKRGRVTVNFYRPLQFQPVFAEIKEIIDTGCLGAVHDAVVETAGTISSCSRWILFFEWILGVQDKEAPHLAVAPSDDCRLVADWGDDRVLRVAGTGPEPRRFCIQLARGTISCSWTPSAGAAELAVSFREENRVVERQRKLRVPMLIQLGFLRKSSDMTHDLSAAAFLQQKRSIDLRRSLMRFTERDPGAKKLLTDE